MRTLILAVLLIAAFQIDTFAQAANKSVVFTETVYSFGTIKEEDGLVSHRFEFTNKGAVPAIITNVESSCGCTTPTWTKAPVPPGGKGFISAEFNPSMRPGNFNKEVTVTFADKTIMVLKISGDVLGKNKSMADVYQYSVGNLNLTSMKVPFAKIKSTEVRKEYLEVANLGSKDVKISFANVPSHLTLKADPEILMPNQTGAIEITYTASKKSGTGFMKDNVTLVVNGSKYADKPIQVSATKQ